MQSLMSFLNNLDVVGLSLFLFRIVASLICITIHELSHGFVAYRMGDPTAKVNGRLTLNPIAHIDPIGLIMMLTVGIGWAKAVPVDMRNFKNPKKGMAITALAGPASNMILSLVMLAVASLVYHFAPANTVIAYILLLLCYIALLSIGLGLFNLIPIPPLDGSKILFSFLPDKAYQTILRYEHYVIAIVVVLSWFGVFSKPLTAAMAVVGRLMCKMTAFPYELFQHYFF